jgi:hypothetical protein
MSEGAYGTLCAWKFLFFVRPLQNPSSGSNRGHDVAIIHPFEHSSSDAPGEKRIAIPIQPPHSDICTLAHRAFARVLIRRLDHLRVCSSLFSDVSKATA